MWQTPAAASLGSLAGQRIFCRPMKTYKIFQEDMDALTKQVHENLLQCPVVQVSDYPTR